MSYICASVWPDSNYETSKKRHCWVQALSVFIANGFNWLLTTRFRLFFVIHFWQLYQHRLQSYINRHENKQYSEIPLPYTLYIFYWCYTAILNLKYFILWLIKKPGFVEFTHRNKQYMRNFSASLALVLILYCPTQ